MMQVTRLMRHRVRVPVRSLSTAEKEGFFVVRLDEHFELLEREAGTKHGDGISKFAEACKVDGKSDEEVAHALSDYRLMVSSVSEKMRLTVEWNDTAKMTEIERVKATAKRVGLDVPEYKKE